MANGTMEKIETVTVGSGGTASITFSNIPATYDDLLIKISLRADTTADYISLRFNSSTTNFTSRYILGDGASASSGSRTDTFQSATVNLSTWTASTFSNADIYIPNYRGSTNKSFSIDTVNENNATTAYMELIAGLWSNTSAITSITMVSGAGSSNFVQHSTATLYGITRVPAGAKATGGVIYDDSSYWYHVFTSSGTFTPNASMSCDVLVVAGGGGGAGAYQGAGGGAGGLRLLASQTVSSGTTVTVGGGGAGGTGGSQVKGTNGSNTSFGSIAVTAGGGGGGYGSATAGASGGSGGGGNGDVVNAAGGSGNAGSYSPAEGYAGGNSSGAAPNYGSGGGGGASAVGAVGTSTSGGNGGAGTDTYNSISFASWLTATNTGSSGKLAGGGGGSSYQGGVGTGGAGGGGNASLAKGSDGAVYTGSGGGGSERSGGNNNGGSGASGIVIVRYAK